MFNNQFIFSKIKFLIFFYKKKYFSKWCVERGWGYPIPDGYGDGTINSNPSGIGYGYGDMLRSRGKGLGRQYPYPTRPIAMSNHTCLMQMLRQDHRHLTNTL